MFIKLVCFRWSDFNPSTREHPQPLCEALEPFKERSWPPEPLRSRAKESERLGCLGTALSVDRKDTQWLQQKPPN